jgi:hypothetical protein
LENIRVKIKYFRKIIGKAKLLEKNLKKRKLDKRKALKLRRTFNKNEQSKTQI